MRARFLSLSAILMGFAGAASAAEGDWFFKPYVGADYQYTMYGDKDLAPGVKSDDLIDTGLNGANVHVGARVHENLGLELGYYHTEDGDKDIAGVLNSKTNISGVTFDVLGYQPIGYNWDLIGTVGLAYSNAEIDIPTVGKYDENEWQARVGAGAQYSFNEALSVRGLVRYQGADFDNTVDGSVVSTAGLNWQF